MDPLGDGDAPMAVVRAAGGQPLDGELADAGEELRVDADHDDDDGAEADAPR